MIDVFYVAATIVFFALMFAYIRGCEKLGGDTDSAEEHTFNKAEP